MGKNLLWLLVPIALAASASSVTLLADGPVPPAKPADIAISVHPEAGSPGSTVEVTMTLTPGPGIKINRYPKIRLEVPDQAGLVRGGKVAVGNETPPPPDQLKSNYFETVDPVKLALRLDPAAAAGEHQVQGKVRYFYCVTASGFCAPARVAVQIPVSVGRN